MHLFLLGQFPSPNCGSLGVSLLYFLILLQFIQSCFEMSPFHSYLSPALRNLTFSVSVAWPSSWPTYSFPQDEMGSPLLAAHKITGTPQTARSSHSPLRPPPGIWLQGPSWAQGHLQLLGFIFHREGLASIRAFLLSSFQTTTAASSSHLSTCHEIGGFLGGSSWEDRSRAEAHPRRAQRNEKPKRACVKELTLLKKAKRLFASLSNLKSLHYKIKYPQWHRLEFFCQQ